MKKCPITFLFTINIEKFEDIIKFGDIIYSSEDFCLRRKYMQFLKFKKLVELDKKVNEIVDGSRRLDDLKNLI